MLLNLALIAVGFALLVGGANWLVDGACQLAARLGVPERVAGLTIVAVGTSLPELVVSVTSAMGGHPDMALGNVAGSCIANLLLILGVSAVIAPVALPRRTVRVEIPLSLGVIALFALLANTGGEVTAIEGAILIAAFAAFTVWTGLTGLQEGADGSADAGSDGEKDAASQANPLVSLGLIVLGAVMLKFGADFVVDSASAIASGFGVSERVIGLTVVAVGTSLPELVTSVVAAVRGNSDIAVGNVIGSNIANLLLVMGAPALFSPIPFDAAYNLDIVLMAVLTVALAGFALTGRRNLMTRPNGALFSAVYVAYVAATLLR